MRSKIVLTAFVVFAFVLQGCNAVAGMGKEVSRVGNALPTPPRSKPGAGQILSPLAEFFSPLLPRQRPGSGQ